MVTRTDAQGRPVTTDDLEREVAPATLTGVRAVHAEHIVSGLTPEALAAILRRAQEGDARDYLTLAADMEDRYLHYASQLQTRRLAIEGIGVSLDPHGAEARVVEAVESLIADPAFHDCTGELLDGIGKGYAVVEPVWHYRERLLRPAAYHPRDQRFFVFDPVSLRELRLAVDGEPWGAPLPAKFIIHRPRVRAGVPVRSGLARPAAFAFMIQAFTLKDWAAFAEVFGMPLRLGRYPVSATEADKRALLRAVAGIANDAAAIVPQGMEIEFHEVTGQRGEAVFGDLLAYVDRQISKLVVGQTMTADDGSSLAQAKVHNEVRSDILRADCRQLAATMNAFVAFFVAINFGTGTPAPRLVWPVAEPEDTKALAESVAKLVPLGLRVSQADMRAKLGLSAPADDDPVLEVPRVPTRSAGAHAFGCACPGCRPPARLAAEGLSGAVPDQDLEAALDALLANELSDWVALTEPMFTRYRDLITRAASFEEVLRALPRLAAEAGSGPLADRLARLTAIARGLGDLAD